MRIGVFGGTFDPPHIGHLSLAEAASEQLELEEVLFLPANQNPMKVTHGVTPALDRLEMVKRLIDGKPKMAVSDMEITRGGPSYTVDTLSELQMVQPADYWFLMGTDALRSLPDWKAPLRLIKMCRLGVVVRVPQTDADALMRVPDDFRSHIDLIHMPSVEISSTDIRDRIFQGKSVDQWVSKDVLKYIGERKLYKN